MLAFTDLLWLLYSARKALFVDFGAMKFAKLIITIAAVVFAAILAFMLIGFLMNLVWYLLIFAALGGAAYIGFKLLQRSQPKQIEQSEMPILEHRQATRELKNAERILDEYRNKLNSGK